MIQCIVLGMIIVIVDILIFLKPDLIWELTEKWKSYRADEPSDFYLKKHKVWWNSIYIVGNRDDCSSLYLRIVNFHCPQFSALQMHISMETLLRICRALNCGVLDTVELVPNEDDSTG